MPSPISPPIMKLLLIASILALAAPASAVIIDNPLSLSTQFLAGIHNGQAGDSSVATETIIAQNILDLSLGETDGNYQSNTVFSYGGTITSTGGQSEVGIEDGGDDTISIPAGWGGALVKYDGPNAGYILYVFGGQASTIPEYPWDLWTTNQTQYQASHVTLFNGTGDVTPDPRGVVPEGGPGVALLGALLLGLGVARRLAKKTACA